MAGGSRQGGTRRYSIRNPAHPRVRQWVCITLFVASVVVAVAGVYALLVLDEDPWWRLLVFPLVVAGAVVRDGWPPFGRKGPSSIEPAVVVESSNPMGSWDVELADGRRFTVSRPLTWLFQGELEVGEQVAVEVWPEDGIAELCRPRTPSPT